ncbi:hypothetical protein ABZV80_41105 [Streptomyces sp. NPDC005132]|uniref:hypothetical protein n=1 Tax=Streptomyces sp. NPDC005132 TaxID=3154294 RepID=UPI0033AA5E07
MARAFKGRREELAAIGVELFYLPPRIERVWRSAKYEDYPSASTRPSKRSAPQSIRPWTVNA